MANTKWVLSGSELGWIALALNREIAELREENKQMSYTNDSLYELGELAIANRERLATKIMDIKNAKVKRIEIV